MQKWYNDLSLPVSIFKKIVETNDYCYLLKRYRKVRYANKLEKIFEEIYTKFLEKRKSNQTNYIKDIEALNLLQVYNYNQINKAIDCLIYGQRRKQMLDYIENEIKQLEITKIDGLLLRYNIVKKTIWIDKDEKLIELINNLTSGKYKLNANDINFYDKLERIKKSTHILTTKIEKNKELLKNITNQKTKEDFNWGEFFMSVTKWHGSISINEMTMSDLADVLNLMEREKIEIEKLNERGKVSRRTI